MSSRRMLIVLPAMLILGLFTSTGASAQEVSFTDIGSTAQLTAVEELAAIDIVHGCTSDQYCPEDVLSRAQVAALMDRSLGLSAGAALSATDAEAEPHASYVDTIDSTHRDAIEAVTAAGLMIGCDAGAFCPSEPITRGQLATVVFRAFDLPDAPADAQYYLDAGTTHDDGINAITAAGFSQGCDLVEFCTDQPLNRGHAAIFLARALDLVETVEIAPFEERKAAYDERVAAEEAAAATAAAEAEAQAEAQAAAAAAEREAALAPGRKAVEVALAQVGKPYRWGAGGPSSFDCSGLTSYAWRAAGKELPRTSRTQYSGTTRISRSELRPGDLVFYHSPISHVAMYIGDGKVVEAANSRYNVRIRTDGLTRRGIVGYGRP